MVRDDNIVVVRSQLRAESAHTLADLSLGSIAFERGAARFQRDTESKMTEIVLNPKNDTLREPEHFLIMKEAPVLPRKVEPIFESERMQWARRLSQRKLFASDLGGQALTAFCPAALEHLLAVGGLHALTEAVTTTALGPAGL